MLALATKKLTEGPSPCQLNFLRPHKHNRFRPLVEDDIISKGNNMPAKWQLMIFLGQQTILQMQNNS